MGHEGALMIQSKTYLPSFKTMLTFSMLSSMLLSGCLNNGMPADLSAHLASRGLPVQILQSVAPLSSRKGYVVLARNPALEKQLIQHFELEPVSVGTRPFADYMAGVKGSPEALWCKGGNPASLKLPDGGQFHYLCLLRIRSGQTLLIAEYAYG